MTSLSKKVMEQQAKVQQAQAEARGKLIQETQDKIFDLLKTVPDLRVGDMLAIIRQLEQGSRLIFESQPLSEFLEDKK